MIKKRGEFLQDVQIKPVLLDEKEKRYSNSSTSEIAQSWNTSFTSPESHDPGNYTYLVHGVSEPLNRFLQNMFLSDMRIPKRNEVDMLRSPERIAEKKLISSSLITPTFRATWSNAGLILKAPIQNVLQMSPFDLGSPFYDPDKANRTTRHLCTVHEVLGSTSAFAHNEVLLLGKSPFGQVEVVGLYITTKLFGTAPELRELQEKIMAHAYRLKLPLIRIESVTMQYTTRTPEVMFMEKEERNAFGFALSLQGKRFVVDWVQKRFEVINPEFTARPMLLHEWKEMREILLASAASNIVIRDNLDKLEIVDAFFSEPPIH